MSYLQVQNLSKSFGDLILFDSINFSIEKSEKVGLIAQNGAGKSTLMSMLVGIEGADSGEIIIQNDIKWSYLTQETQLDPQKTVIDSCFSPFDETAKLVGLWEQASARNDSETLNKLLPEMEANNAWDYEQRAREVLTKLRVHDFDQLVGKLSGGEAKRLALAAVLISQPDLLLLDEPTNHLDLEAIEWLEDYLQRQEISLLLVTHDRYFLDRICNRILEIDQRNLYSYQGNYDYYLEKRRERIDAQESEASKASNLLRKELDWMRRQPQARGGKAKYRIDAFYRLQDKAQSNNNSRELALENNKTYIGKKIFEAHNVSHAFGSKQILKNFNYVFSRFDKVGIVGDNGVGKTTFIRLLLGQLQADSGSFEVGETVRFGHYSQEGLQFDEEKRVIDVIEEIATHIKNENTGQTLSASSLLNQFLFPPDKQYTPIYKLSGGEKRRLYLCSVLINNPNFLILDEPTNDLDLLTLNVLEEYLEEFQGCVIIVSHDRFFMDKVVNHILAFEGNAIIRDFPGSYSQYRVVKQAEEDEQKKAEEAKRLANKENKNTPPRRQNEERKLSYKEKRELEALELSLPALEEEKASLEQAMSRGDMDTDSLIAAGNRIAEIIEEIETQSMRWLELSDI